MRWHEARVLLPTRIVEPPDFDPSESHTLIVAFHGFGATAGGFQRIAEALAEEGLLVALPESPYPLLVGQKLGFSWFPDIGDEELEARAGRLVMLDQVQAVLEDLEERYSLDEVYTLGFSEGAVAALGSAVFNHDRFEGAILFGLPLFSSDWFPEDSLAEGTSVRTLFLHGEQDERAPFSASQQAHDVLSEAGYDTSLHPFPGGHTVPLNQLAHAVDWILQ